MTNMHRWPKGLAAAWILMVVWPGPAKGDEIDLRIRGITAYADGKTSDTSFLAGLAKLSPEDRQELIKRSSQSPPQTRVLLLYELIKHGTPEAYAELDALLKSRAATGQIKRVGDLLELREFAWNGREKNRPEMQSIAAGILLAIDGVHEEGSTLTRMTRVLSNRKKGAKSPPPEVREAATHIGYLHVRGIRSSASQRELEDALLAYEDQNLQVIVAAFLGASGDPRSMKPLLEAIRDPEIKSSTVLDRVARTLIANGDYTERDRCALIPDLVKMVEDFELSDRKRHTARLVASRITGKSKVEEMLAWAAKRGQELDGAPAAPGKDLPVKEPAKDDPGMAPEKTPPPPPDAGEEATRPPPPPKKPDPQADCARWLLLAKNFMNMKNYEKAEENLRRVLEKSPEGKLAEEARELMRRIEAVKGL